MKKLGLLVCWLGLGVIALSACSRQGGEEPEQVEWLSAELARAVEQQLQPVSSAGNVAYPLEGSHSGNGLEGVADLPALKDAVREIEEGHFGGGPDYQVPSQSLPSVPLPFPLPVPADQVISKLKSITSASGTHYERACDQDSDGDGVADVKEPLGQGGLCLNPGSAVCTPGTDSFTVKFSDCVVAQGGLSLTATWGFPWGSFWQTAGATTRVSHWTTAVYTCSVLTVPGCPGPGPTPIVFTQTITPIGSTRWTNTTTSGKLEPTFTITGSTPCMVMGGGGFGGGGYAGGGKVTGSGGTVTATVTLPCAPVSPALSPACFTWTWKTTFTWVTNLFSSAEADVVYNGAITLHSGQGEPDEQVLHTMYNDLTKVWDMDGTGLTSTNPYLTYNGQVMEYRILTPYDLQAEGAACLGGDCYVSEGMIIEDLQIRLDRDGDANTGYLGADYTVRRGSDFMDGAFIFTDDLAIVLSRDKNGRGTEAMSPMVGMIWGPAGYLVGKGPNGLPLYAISLYDRDTLPNQVCGDPIALPCWVKVEINSRERTFNLLEADNCPNLDLSAGRNNLPF